MMAYNPAISRVLEKGGVSRFADLMTDAIPKLYGSVTRDTFMAFHDDTCGRILADFKTARRQTLSYGQAQKPLNVFLKVYVDWAKQPTRELAEHLTPLLHVPLDSVMMKFMKKEFSAEYEAAIGALRRQKLERITERVKTISAATPGAVARHLVGNEFSLAAIDKEIYLRWQDFFRSLWPGKPVQLDIIWAIKRRPVDSKTEKGCEG